MENNLRRLPSVDKVLSDPRIRALESSFPHDLIVSLIREELDCCRASASRSRELPSLNEILENVVLQADALSRPSLRPLINATGVVLHTNLGRAPLSEKAISAYGYGLARL